MLRRGRHARAPRIFAAAMRDLECCLRHNVSTRSGAAAAIMRGRWFFFADGPNARGVIQTGFALHDPRYAVCTAPDPVVRFDPNVIPGIGRCGHPPLASWQGVGNGRWRPPPPSGSPTGAFIEAGVPDARYAVQPEQCKLSADSSYARRQAIARPSRRRLPRNVASALRA
jgi:hypothetical protein